MLQARLLGQYEIRLDGQLIKVASRSTQSILAYLLLHPNTAHRREKLAGLFWADSSESNARSNLRHALWLIRKAFGSGIDTRLECDHLDVTYRPQPGDQLDVDSFEGCPEDECSTDALLAAVSTYKGELLPGFYEEWVSLERERLHAVHERKMENLLDHLLAEERWKEVLEWGEHWVASGSTPEPAYRALMLAQAGLGNLAGAAAQYQRCVEALSRELGVEPSEATRAAFEHIRSGEVEPAMPRPDRPTPIIPTLPAFLEEPEKPRPVFVARDAELATFDAHLQETLKGQTHVVFVSGEAGSGKSALLQEFMRRSLTAHPDLVVGWGTCNALFGQGVPYLPFRDVMNTLAGDIEPLYANGAISRSQATHWLASFPWVVQSLLEHGPGLLNSFLSGSALAARASAILPGKTSWRQRIERLTLQETDSAGTQEKTQLFDQYAQVLRSIASQHPLMIFLDDLQWMDPGTGRLLFHLVRRLQNARILIAGAYRLEEVALGRHGEQHPLEKLLNEFQSSFGEISIDLDQARETSGRDFVDALLDTEPNRLDEAFRQELHRRTQGQPLFAIQLLRDLQERGEILQDEQGRWTASTGLNWQNLPAQVEGIIAERFGRLDPALQDLLLAASVEGEQFTVQVLERVQGTPVRTLLHVLSRELEKRHRLVQELGETRAGGQRLVRFRFVHALVQQYLYCQLGAAERTVLHREIAEALEMLCKDDIAAVAAPLARHYREAGVREKAVEYLLLAGDQARSLYAHLEAIDHYQQALAYLKEMGAVEQTARTLMKLYLVFHSSFDFRRAQQTLVEYNALWQQPAGHSSQRALPPAQNPYELSTPKAPTFDPGLCDTLFDMQWTKELFCGLVEWSQDRNVIPLAAKAWDVLEDGRRYVFHLRQDLSWSDGQPVTAGDFAYAWKRVLDPATNAQSANLLYDIRGARDYHEGRVAGSDEVGVRVRGPYTLEVELEEPCGYFPYLLGDPITFAVPQHVIESAGQAWTEPGRIVTNGAFQLESSDQPPGRKFHFTRNPRYFGSFGGNIERVTLSFHQNELDAYHAFAAGKLDMVEFLIPPLQPEELKRYRELGQLRTSAIPFVDAIYFMADRPPFDNPDLRRAFALATDREKLAREIGNQLPATGGYIPPGLPGHSPDIGLPYDPSEARRILAMAGYPQGRGLPPVTLLMGLVGLEKGDALVFSRLQEMWRENLGVTIQKQMHDWEILQFDDQQDFSLFFLGWLADFPDPASFLQANYLLDQSHWRNPQFDTLVDAGRRTLDQEQRMELYRNADRILMQEAVVLPLFYGHICELTHPWVHQPAGSSIYSSQWKDITLMPH